MKQVVQNYIKLLPFIGLSANEEGQIYEGSEVIGRYEPVTIDGKPVYLPTQDFLKSLDKSKVGFHPLSESVVMKASPMIKMIQDSMTLHLNTIVVVFMQTLIAAAIAQKKNTLKSKDPNLMNILVGNEDCTADTQTFFNAIMKAVLESKGSFKFIRVYFKQGGDINEEKFSRICSVACPLLDQLERPGAKEIFGVTPKRKKDIGVLIHLLKTILPGLDTKAYSRGSNNKVAPYVDSLLQTLRVLSKDINATANALQEVEPCATLVEYISTVPSDLDEFDDYEILRNQIPPLAYNDGSGFLTNEDNRRVDLVERESEPVPLERAQPSFSIYDKPQVVQQPIAAQPVAIVQQPQQFQRVPGTRAVLHNVSTDTDVVQNDYVPRRHSDRTRNASYGGGRGRDDDDRDNVRRGYSTNRDSGRRQGRRSSREERPRMSDFRDVRDVQDEIHRIKSKIKDLEYDRYYDEADDLKDIVLRELYAIEDDFLSDRDRDRLPRSSRPQPRGSRGRNDRERGGSRNERDRFGRR